MTKTELVKQLMRNSEIMTALQYAKPGDLEKDIKGAHGRKDGCLTWIEFLNCFFLRDAGLMDKIDGNDWWTKVDAEGKKIASPIKTPSKHAGDKSFRSGDSAVSKDSRGNQKRSKLLREFRDVTMTPALEILM